MIHKGCGCNHRPEANDYEKGLAHLLLHDRQYSHSMDAEPATTVVESLARGRSDADIVNRNPEQVGQ